MTDNSCFRSVFRINGFPILPPLISDELKEQISIYKQQAIEIEKKILKKRDNVKEKHKSDEILEEFQILSLKEAENENLEFPQIDNQKAKIPDEEQLESSYSTGIDSSFQVPDNCTVQNNQNDLKNEDPESQTNTESSDKNTIHENLFDSLSEIDVEPLVPDNSKLPESDAVEKDTTENQEIVRGGTSVSLQETIETSPDFCPAQLIRSNSYTLDSPSPLLLQRMAAEGIFFNKTPKTIGRIVKTPAKKLFTNTITRKSSNHILKPKKSPYETKLGGHTKKKKNQINIKSQTKSANVKKNPQKAATPAKSKPGLKDTFIVDFQSQKQATFDLEISGVQYLPKKAKGAIQIQNTPNSAPPQLEVLYKNDKFLNDKFFDANVLKFNSTSDISGKTYQDSQISTATNNQLIQDKFMENLGIDRPNYAEFQANLNDNSKKFARNFSESSNFGNHEKPIGRFESRTSQISNYSDVLVDLSMEDQESIFKSHKNTANSKESLTNQSKNHKNASSTDSFLKASERTLRNSASTIISPLSGKGSDEPFWRDQETYNVKLNHKSPCPLDFLPYNLPSNEAKFDQKVLLNASPSVEEVQETCNKKMQLLVQQQQDEYQKMQEKFKKQQEELLKNFCGNKSENVAQNFPEIDIKNRTSTPLDVFASNQQPTSSDYSNLSESQTLYLSNTLTTDTDYHQDINDESFVSENFYTCVNKEQLDLDNFASPRKDRTNINSYMEHIKNNYQIRSGNIQSEIAKIQSTAATTITAHVRGYLTRRLFKTQYVRNTIQTIRDTLYLILDLEFEEQATGVRRTSNEDINFKLRILKQLQESINKLKLIFIVIAPKERMKIIAKDREMNLTKRLSRNASVTSQKSSMSRSSERAGSAQSTNQMQTQSMDSIYAKGDTNAFLKPSADSNVRPSRSQTRNIVTNVILSPNFPKRNFTKGRASAGSSIEKKPTTKPWR